MSIAGHLHLHCEGRTVELCPLVYSHDLASAQDKRVSFVTKTQRTECESDRRSGNGCLCLCSRNVHGELWRGWLRVQEPELV